LRMACCLLDNVKSKYILFMACCLAYLESYDLCVRGSTFH
jgi:hypothetical protein